MTRKRFIKLVMARGIQRNDAQERAAHVKETGSYSTLYVLFLFQGQYFMSDLARSLDGFFKALYSATESVCEFERVAFGIDLASGAGGSAE